MTDEVYDLVEEYEILEKKYRLPPFDSLAEEFDIEKISEKESSFLLREIRKTVTEKTYSYAHLLESFINPNPHPMFLFSLVKNVTLELKSQITEAYTELSQLQMKAIRLDLFYSEEKEAQFIKESYEIWQTLKRKIDQILQVLDKKEELKNEPMKNYYD